MEALLVLLGYFGAVFGIWAGYWWVAHQMAWWTFGLAVTGGYALRLVLKVASEVRNSTSNRARR